MQLDARGDVSIVEIVVFLPLLVAAVAVCLRHGFKKAEGWIFLIALCLIRIAGAACDLAALSSPSVGLFEAIAILSSVGVSPLLLATIGVFGRLFIWINANSKPTITTKHLRLLQLLVIAGMILSISGGTTTTINADGTTNVTVQTKVAIIIYIAALVLCTALLLFCLRQLGLVPSSERQAAYTVALVLPLVAVRIVYAALVVFVHDDTFSQLGGSVGAYAGMALVEEFLAVIVYVVLGFRLEKLEKVRGDLLAMAGAASGEEGLMYKVAEP